MLRFIALILLVLPLSGCGIIIAESMANSDRTSASREEFNRQLQGTNLARREQGQPELDTCSERYWFDRDWAMKETPCKERLVRWENGDSTALNPKGMVLARTVPVVLDSVVKYYRKLDKKRIWGQRVYR